MSYQRTRRTLTFCGQNAVHLSGGPIFEGRCGTQNVRKRDQGRSQEIAGYKKGTDETARRDKRAHRSQGRRFPEGHTREAVWDAGAQRSDGLLREVSNRRPREELSRLEVPQRPSQAQGQSDNSSAELSQPSASPQETRPHNSTSNQGPNSRPAASFMQAESFLRDWTDAPRLRCAARVPGARRGRAGDGQNPRP